MAEYSKAFIIGGWSEDHDFLAGLTREVSEGPNRFVDEADPLTLAEAFGRVEDVGREARRRIVITHSAGMMAVRQAGMVVALSGVEPTPLSAIICGGYRVGVNRQVGHDAYVIETGLINGFMEVTRHPTTLGVLLKARAFSTVRTMIGRAGLFPDGRVYLPADKDEFGFGSHGEVDLAQRHGVTAHMLPGWHNQPLLHPREAAGQIKTALNSEPLKIGITLTEY